MATLRSFSFTLLLAAAAAAPTQKHIIVIVGDDLGRNDLGARNGGRTLTPAINALISEGISMTSYYSFKICSPSRASSLTGRYPWGAGFYDMSFDPMHTTANFTLYPQHLQAAGYKTHALGKWDVGMSLISDTGYARGFDTQYGYLYACNGDYWYHSASGGYACPEYGPYNASVVDWVDSTHVFAPADRLAINGTYNRNLISDRAVDIIAAHPTSEPLFMYIAFMNGHEACEGAMKQGLQAPLATAELYNTTVLDTYKLSGAMLTELDYGVDAIVCALKAAGLWEDTLLSFYSDNGGPLDHSSNAPLRGGKHTFYEGGLRLEAFLSGGVVPLARRGTSWQGLAHASDWYATLVEGVAGLTLTPNSTGGPRPLDGMNLWPALLSGGVSPRTEVVHQVSNAYFDEGVTSIRVNDLKLIRGIAGDNRTIAWPEVGKTPVPLGRSGAVIEPGTDHVRGPEQSHGATIGRCEPACLFNVSGDPGETVDLAALPEYAGAVAFLTRRLHEAGVRGPPNAWHWNTTQYQNDVRPQLCDKARALGTSVPLDY